MKRSVLLPLLMAFCLLCACSSVAELPYLSGLTAGRYLVSSDLPAGLYTCTLSQGESCVLSVSGEDGAFSRMYELSGPASVTLYLPNKAEVTLEGQGHLSEMDDQFVSWSSFEGVGRFLCGRQLPQGVEIQVRRLEGAENALYSIGSLRSDRGLEEETATPLEDDEWHSVYLNADEFLFIRGCALQING